MPQETKSNTGSKPGSTAGSALGQGDVVTAAVPEDLRRALDEALDYRGDVTLVLNDGRRIEGYLFDRIPGPSLAASFARVLRAADGVKERIAYAEITELHFSGKDTAAGKTWENWLRRYAEKRIRGEAASIETDPLA